MRAAVRFALLAAVAAGLGVAAYSVSSRRSAPPEPPPGREFFRNASPQDIARVVIEPARGGRIELIRGDSAWRVDTPFGERTVAPVRAKRFLAGPGGEPEIAPVRALRVGTTPATFASFGLDGRVPLVTFLDAGGAVLEKFYLSPKKAPANGSYVRPAGADEVFHLPLALYDNFDFEYSDDLRDRAPFRHVVPDRVVRMRFWRKDPPGEFEVLRRGPTEWAVVEDGTETPGTHSAVRRYASDVQALKIHQFRDKMAGEWTQEDYEWSGEIYGENDELLAALAAAPIVGPPASRTMRLSGVDDIVFVREGSKLVVDADYFRETESP